jgi:hypothetical protein
MAETTKEQGRQFVEKWQLFGRLKVWERHPVLCKEPFDDEKIKAMIASGELSYDTDANLARYQEQELSLRQYQPKPLSDLAFDFRGAGYSTEFVKDLENGLKKSSPQSHE